MSKAFTREDVEPPERSGRKRSASGLPPGAINYITGHGAERLREELSRARAAAEDPERVAELKQVLDSATIVDPPESRSNEVAFGARVTVEGPDGDLQTYTVVGVDEVSFEPDGVTWISPIGKSLLAAKLNDNVMVGDRRLGKVLKIDYRDG
jgi:transcription elongation factor GreB